METETATPTTTPTPTVTPTETATATPTPNLYIESTMEVSGEYARIAREMSMGDYWQIMLMTALLVSIWLMYIVWRIEKGNEKND